MACDSTYSPSTLLYKYKLFDAANSDINYFDTFISKNKVFFLENVSFFLNYLDNLLVVVMIYFFFKSLVLSLVLELLWPTQIFNKKNNISYERLNKFNYSNTKQKSFVNFSLKAINYNPYFFILNSFFIN